MTNRVVARAPGKLFVLGEYAVLDGCPAVVAAVDRFIEVRLGWTDGGGVTQITSGPESVKFATPTPPEETGPLRFVIAAFRSILARCPGIAHRSFTIDIVSRLTAQDGAKVGLGSSAAVTAGVIAALFAAAGREVSEPECRDQLFAAALEAHRRVQGELGSGADVASSVHGGLILFRPRNGLAEISSLALPTGTRLLAAWTGEPASTPDLVSRYRGAANGHAAQRAAFVEASRAAVSEFVTGLAQGSLPLAAVLASEALLEQLAANLSLPILTPRLQQLVEIARTQGAAAKISGAGGGDCGIAFARDAAAAQRLRSAWQAAGLVPLDFSICHEGVSVVRA
jgi:phosphomevalonate kinase